MLGEDTRYLAVLLVADYLGEVLHEVAATGDVQHLQAAADGEHRHVARESALEQGELGAVARRPNTLRLGVRLRAVRLGIEVVAAREQQPVEHVERLLHPMLARRYE